MERFGFIHEKLEIKFLILFILARLEAPIDRNTLTDLTLVDDGINYFDIVECVTELIETAHVAEENGHISITEKGLRNGEATERSIPTSVRLRAEEKALTLAQAQRRSALIKAETLPRPGGGHTVKLSLNDGLDEILALELYTATESQAKAIQGNFKNRAEQIYGQIITLLADEEP